MSWLVWTPTSWARNHHLHHKVTGNRDQSLFRWSDTVYVTKQQLAAKPLWVQRAYRLLRHPAVFLWFGPLMNWFVDYRLPHSGLRAPRVSPRLRGFVCHANDVAWGQGSRRRRKTTTWPASDSTAQDEDLVWLP